MSSQRQRVAHKRRLQAEAESFLRLVDDFSQGDNNRYSEVATEITRSGTYHHNQRELTMGAKLAWRNSVKCIGRLHWQSLSVLDYRSLESAEDIFEAQKTPTEVHDLTEAFRRIGHFMATGMSGEN